MAVKLLTLLAYLDDMLDAAQTKAVGAKISQSKSTQDLIAKIKRVTRRRGLTTPDDPNLPSARPMDPNTIAEYLDQVSPRAQGDEVEKTCLESDVNLAEVAACHQITTLVQSGAADTPPLAYQRMYGLVKGPESIPLRRPPTGLDEFSEDYDDARGQDEFGDSPRQTIPIWKQLTSRKWAPIAAVVMLALGLTFVLYQMVIGRARGPQLPGPVAAVSQQEPTEPDELDDLVVDSWENGEALVMGPGHIPILTGLVAARPTLPANMFLALGVRPVDGNPIDDDPVAPIAPPDVDEEPLDPDGPPSKVRRLLGRHSSIDEHESLLFRKVVPEEGDAPLGNDCLAVPKKAAFSSGDPLIVLPGYRSELTLDSGVQLELVGNFEEDPSGYVLDSSTTFHAHPQLDADISFHRGRLVIRNTDGKNSSRVRLRFRRQIWDVELMQPGSIVGLELTGRLERSSWRTHSRLLLIAHGGPVKLNRGERSTEIPPGNMVVWDNTSPPADLDAVFPSEEAPVWLERTIPVLNEVFGAKFTVEKQVLEKIANVSAEREIALIRVAFEESLASVRPLERRLALFSLGATDNLRLVIQSLDDPTRPDVREAAMATLWHWLGSRPFQDRALRTAFTEAGFTGDDLDTALTLLRGFGGPGEGVFTTLLELMEHERLAIRELAWSNLRELAQPLPRVTYDPAGSLRQQRRATESLKRSLVPRR